MDEHGGPEHRGQRDAEAGEAPTGQSDSLQIEIAAQPQPHDEVLEAGGAQVFLEPHAAETLDDMVLDATHDERGVRFAVSRRPQPPSDPGAHDG